MKKLAAIILFILIVLVGCQKSTESVNITTDRNSYTPAMSSVQGITLTPNFKGEKNNKNIEYHWTVNRGEFMGQGRDVINQGKAVVWSAVENSQVVEIKDNIKVNLEVIDNSSKKTLAKTELTIIANDGLYKVKK